MSHVLPSGIVLWIGFATVVAALPPEAIFFNGKIITVNNRFEIVQAMATAGERILAVGSNPEILKLAGPSTRKVDLRGRTVLPGLMDSHTHASDAAMYEWTHPVPEMESIDDVLRYIANRAKALPEGEWIFVSQVFITRLRQQRFPTRSELDQVAPKHPVVFRTGPDASLNSLALQRSGIDRNFQVTDGAPCRLERDSTGELTGILRNCARFIKYTPSGPAPTEKDKLEQIKLLFKDYNAVGLTSIADRDADDEAVELYRKLRDSGQLTVRIFLNLSVNPHTTMEKIRERIEQASQSPLHRYNNQLWLRAIKVYLDGGMLTGSAYMLQPWGVSAVYSITDPSYRGMRYIEPDKLYEIFKLALANGLQPTAHAVGDGAVTTMVDVYERIDQHMPVRPGRPCITHANFMTLEAIRRMKKLGVVADLQPAWLERDGATLLKQFGYARLAYFQPYKTLFDEGVMVGGGSDHMQKIGGMRSINPYNPFFGMWITLTRQPRWTHQVLHPEQRISREQAIRLYTIQNAFLTFEEKEKGSLEPGKLADFIVLDRDILTCPIDQVRSVQVLETYLGGKRVYAR
ncbi:MAG: amidohydrolase [Bryobacteraceae bacterium]|nr:amidohydrolase [Bryobacteraceae bacterium]MDW8379165.1 amidohydrolase [Bryobacterales bacterium]